MSGRSLKEALADYRKCHNEIERAHREDTGCAWCCGGGFELMQELKRKQKAAKVVIDAHGAALELPAWCDWCGYFPPVPGTKKCKKCECL